MFVEESSPCIQTHSDRKAVNENPSHLSYAALSATFRVLLRDASSGSSCILHCLIPCTSHAEPLCSAHVSQMCLQQVGSYLFRSGNSRNLLDRMNAVSGARACT